MKIASLVTVVLLLVASPAIAHGPGKGHDGNHGKGPEGGGPPGHDKHPGGDKPGPGNPGGPVSPGNPSPQTPGSSPQSGVSDTNGGLAQDGYVWRILNVLTGQLYSSKDRGVLEFLNLQDCVGAVRMLNASRAVWYCTVVRI